MIEKLEHLSEQWKHEYLTELRDFHKSHTSLSVDVCQGDIVLIKEDNLKRNAWTMGKVEELITGQDGVTRGAKVRISSTGKSETVSRPLQKLFPFEFTRVRNATGEEGQEVDKDQCGLLVRNENEAHPRITCTAAKGPEQQKPVFT